ncbi:urease subunit gamma [Ureaplasma ceti]|uniref:Urease subunit gamma n=1 Tax=Ureaplasma ceti TaxID=3119530 RepID=A0ABP9U9I4_9BACT
MYLTLKEMQKLMISVAGEVASKRKARGVKLNYPESVAYITNFVIEGARDGKTVSQLMADARKILKIDEVMPGVDSMVGMIQVECTFPDGTKLVTVHDPICE